MTRAAVARPDAIRRHNLGLLLTQVHIDGELTRAELTQRLHMSRSTIGALVADLSDLGLVVERVPAGGERAGRPSHVVGPRPDGPYVVAVDVDVTHVTIAAVGIGGFVLGKRMVPTPTPPEPEAVARIIVESAELLASEIGAHQPAVGIGVSVPGTVGRHSGIVEFAPNLDWRNVAFRDMVAELAPPGMAVHIGNDADLAVLAEHLRGNARGCDDVVFLIARVGVGAGIIVDGRPLRGHDGLAGEVGHNVVDVSGPLCHCGKRGCVETYIGDNALLELAGLAPPVTTEKIAYIFAEAAADHQPAAEAIRTVGDALGRALATLVNVLNPQRILLGGSLAGVLEHAPDSITAAIDRHVLGGFRGPLELLPPALGEDSSLLGAAEIAFAGLLADPVSARVRVTA